MLSLITHLMDTSLKKLDFPNNGSRRKGEGRSKEEDRGEKSRKLHYTPNGGQGEPAGGSVVQ